MKTPLQTTLAALAPSISIVTHWEHDPDARFSELTGPGDAFENEDSGNWQAWQSEIRATVISVISGGELVTGSAYLGGTWEKYGDDPATSNPEISGYELQMTREALTELRGTLGASDSLPFPYAESLFQQIDASLEYCKAEAGRRYDEQRGSVANA